jgi:uncharacterized membrane protein required for colicin V production
MFYLLALAIFAIVVAANWWLGLWSNLLSLVNFLLAALIASSFYENVATKLSSINENIASYDYLLDFICVWLLFFVSFGILRGITEVLSAKQVQFDKITELAGRSVLSAWLGFAFLQFALFTFHLAPIAPSDYAVNPKESVLGFGPDRMWLSLIQSRSRGALSSTKSSNQFGLASPYNLDVHPDDTKLEARVFDPMGQFILQKTQRRKDLAGYPTLRKGS